MEYQVSQSAAEPTDGSVVNIPLAARLDGQREGDVAVT